MTVVSFGGPFVILFVVRGGDRPNWPPESRFEWLVVFFVFTSALALFLSCVTIRLWYRPPK
jgi:hypothetical protein